MNKPKLQKNGEPERRAKCRFPMEQEVGYKILYGQRVCEPGTGKSLNISSGGVWFTTESPLAVGMPVELSMHWPALLNDSCPLQLMIYGSVIRSNGQGAAVSIERYEFRTRGPRTLQLSQFPQVELRMP